MFKIQEDKETMEADPKALQTAGEKAVFLKNSFTEV